MVKRLGKNLLCAILERHVRRLRSNNEFEIIAVAGSVGKTSTKLAIAQTLETGAKVRYQEGNYNDRLTVPLVFFGETEPAIFNVWAWLKLLARTSKASRQTYPYEYVVLELGTDAPGQLQAFAYLKPEYFVLTAIAPEHMEFFKTLDNVAQEELTPVWFSDKVLINTDDVSDHFRPDKEFMSYGLQTKADYTARLDKAKLYMKIRGVEVPTVRNPLLGWQGAKSVLAAAAVAKELGWNTQAILLGVKAIKPTAGRMQILPGIKGAMLIDDTYNASPIAVKAALDVLYDLEAPHRIAILGTMNELGEDGPAAHEEIGAYCDPKKLDLVVTIGQPAADYLMPAAKKAGCKTVSFISPREAGVYVKEHLKEGAIVLAKGSQNGVFAEEALKPLLNDPKDSRKLVRQSPYWLNRKKQQFSDLIFD